MAIRLKEKELAAINISITAVCKSWSDRHIQRRLRFAAVLVLLVFLLPAVEALVEKLADKPTYKKYFPGIIGDDDREWVSRSFSAFNAIGKINIRGGRTVQWCTGTLIAPNLVVTAAHCLFSKGSERLFSPRNIIFVSGVLGGKYLAHATAKCVHLAKSYRNPATNGLRKFFNDVAVVVLDKELNIPPIAPVAEDAFKEDSLLVHPSYPRDSRYRLKVHSGCRLQRKTQGIWLTNCDTNFGSSGGPVLVSENQQYRLAAVMVGIFEHKVTVAIPISAWRHLIKKEHSCVGVTPKAGLR